MFYELPDHPHPLSWLYDSSPPQSVTDAQGKDLKGRGFAAPTPKREPLRGQSHESCLPFGCRS